MDQNAVIVITFIGFDKKEISAAADLKTIKLSPSSNPLDEVKVIAYGQTTERDNVGDVSTVSSKEIGEQPVSNPLETLEGRIPGLFVTQSTGFSGSGVNVSIRGQNSISNGNFPLYVIDGVRYPAQLLPNNGFVLGSSGGTGTEGSPLSFINPSDIESISVLKDADATAIYGSQGANGVILITTKKGKAGKTSADINFQQGWGEVANELNELTTPQYLAMREEALKNDGITPSLANGDYDLLFWDNSRYANWQKVLIGNTSQYTNAQGSINGGNENTQFLISGNYHRETTVFPGAFSDQKGSLHFNINNSSPDKKFNVSLTGGYLIDNDLLPSSDLTAAALRVSPDAPALYNANGTLNWDPTSSGTSTFINPLAQDLNTYLNQTKNLIANSTISYKILPDLTIKSGFDYSDLLTNETLLYPLESTAPEDQVYTQRTATCANYYITSWTIEPQLEFKKQLGKGRLDALLGATIEQIHSQNQTVQGVGYSSDQVMQDILAAPTIYAQSAVQSIYKYAALFGRLNYIYDDKYIIDLTERRDGSSRFGPANEFHTFAAAGLGWVFTKEAFFENELSFLSFGKVRGSYGTTGNDQIGNYQYLSLYTPTTGQVPYQGQSSLAPANLPNPYLQWELTKKLEIGLETGFLKDRILFTMNYSQNRSSNQLLSYNLPIITGFTGIAENFPATVQNTSWEFSLTTTNVVSKDFSWKSSFNATLPDNKLIAFPGLASSSYANNLIIGQPITMMKLFHFLGVDPATGLYKFSSTTDDLNPQFNTDRNVIVNLAPTFFGGFSNSFSYKSFKLDLLINFVKQRGVNDLFTTGNLPGIFSGGYGNQLSSVLTAWQKPGDVTNVERLTTGYSNYTSYFDAQYSDAAYTDASYIRLKNLSLSWQCPPVWTKQLHLQQARLFVQGQNLLTWTDYKGLDPESLSTQSLPPLRVLTAGVEIGL